MTAPQRIRLSRKKGWRKPEGAIVVSRPSKWSNPFRVYHCDSCGHWDVIDDNGVTYLIDHKAAQAIKAGPQSHIEAVRTSVRLYFEDAVVWFGGRFEAAGLDVTELRGHDLACWCPLDSPCHADVLLELANAEVTR